MKTPPRPRCPRDTGATVSRDTGATVSRDTTVAGTPWPQAAGTPPWPQVAGTPPWPEGAGTPPWPRCPGTPPWPRAGAQQQQEDTGPSQGLGTPDHLAHSFARTSRTTRTRNTTSRLGVH